MPERGCVFLRVDVYVSIVERDLPAERLLVRNYRAWRLPTGKLTAQMCMQPGYPFLEENEIEKEKKK